MNVRRLLTLLTLPLLISGCSTFSFWGQKKVDPVVVQTKAAERTKLNLAEPSPLKGRELEWIVITPENADQVFKTLKDKNVDLVLFSLTDDGYEQLALSMAEIRNFIASQRAVIGKYKQYYESSEQK